MNASIGIKVSVIVTTYNQEATIAQTLDSILMQECDFPYEIQLSDDCSTDSTPEICQHYADKYPHIIRYIRNSVNRGCRDNYFDTLLRCNAPYIADCAGDDYWVDPHKLQKQVEVLDSDPDITLVHTNWAYLDNNSGNVTQSGIELYRKKFLESRSGYGKLFLDILLNRGLNIIHPCTAMYRKSIILSEYNTDLYLFRNSEFPCEDMQLRCICAYYGKIAYLNDITLHYRIGHSSVSSQDNYIKTFDFYFGSLKLNFYIANKFHVAQSISSKVHSSDAAFLFSQAFFAIDRHRLTKLISFLDSNKIHLPLTSRIYVPFTHNNLTWRFAILTKKIFSLLKLRLIQKAVSNATANKIINS